MKIYTKTGDAGETSLFGGQRVPKDTLRIEAYGTVDELNSMLGVVRSFKPKSEIDEILDRIQHELFTLGADLATPLTKEANRISRMHAGHVEELEKRIDSLETTLPSLSVFILPGGSQIAAHLHLARTICRRAERFAVRLARREDIGSTPIVYLNRLSDLLFVLARYANKVEGTSEVHWNAPK